MAELGNTVCPKIGSAQWTCTHDECTCHRREYIWIEPKYPGDAVRQQVVTRGSPVITDFGDIRIMDYGEGSKQRYRVATFCPGYETSYPGDTPKMNPEFDHWCSGKDEANAMYDEYMARAHSEGWKNWERK